MRAERIAATVEIEAALAKILAPSTAVIERRPLAHRSTYPLEVLLLRVGSGEVLQVLFKDLGRSVAGRPPLRPRFVRDAGREIAVYRDVLAPSGLSAPAYVGAVEDAERRWLFLEHVPGDPLWQSEGPEIWRQAAAWLGQMHARFAGGIESSRLLRYDTAHYRRWLRRARRLAARRGGSRRERAALASLEPAFQRALAWLENQPVTLVHGEFYPSNVLVAAVAGRPRIRPVDWETAGLGPGALDLAALVAGWDEDNRNGLSEAYRRAFPSALRPSILELQAALNRARLLLAVQWLGWSARWSPPADQDHDWLAAALELGG